MHAFFHAVNVFLDHLEAVRWRWLGAALACHLTKGLVRAVAWRAIVAAACPGSLVRFRSVLGAQLAGVGVNAVVPVRGGDLLKLYLVRRSIAGSTYPTLAATLLVETLVDFVIGSMLLGWAIATGILPGLDLIPKLPSVDWGWPLRHPDWAYGIGGALAVPLAVGGVWLVRRIRDFWRRVRQGFSILRTPGRYVRRVVSLQLLSWALRLSSIYCFLRAFGVRASLHNAFVVQVVQSLSTVVPLTPGGAGTEQGLLVYVFGGKLSSTSILSFSVGMHIALVVVNVVLGLAAILLMLRTLRWRRVVDADHAAAQEEPPPGFG